MFCDGDIKSLVGIVTGNWCMDESRSVEGARHDTRNNLTWSHFHTQKQRTKNLRSTKSLFCHQYGIHCPRPTCHVKGQNKGGKYSGALWSEPDRNVGLGLQGFSNSSFFFLFLSATKKGTMGIKQANIDRNLIIMGV